MLSHPVDLKQAVDWLQWDLRHGDAEAASALSELHTAYVEGANDWGFRGLV
jgi:hypothetical protein